MKSNIQMQKLVLELKKQSDAQKVHIWRRVAEDLEKPTRQRRIVNLNKLEQFVNDDEIAIVPGKVLGNGELNKKINVAAYAFSQSAVEKISNAKGKTMTIQELMKSNPKGNNVRIIG